MTLNKCDWCEQNLSIVSRVDIQITGKSAEEICSSCANQIGNLRDSIKVKACDPYNKAMKKINMLEEDKKILMIRIKELEGNEPNV